MEFWKKLKYWQKYGIAGAVLHPVVTFIIILTSKGCSGFCINPFNLLIMHVLISTIYIEELLEIDIFNDQIFIIVMILVSVIWGFIIGAIIGKLKNQKKVRLKRQRSRIISYIMRRQQR